MRFLVLFITVILCSNSLFSGTPPFTFEYCTTDYNGVTSNGTSVLCYGTHGIITRSTDKGNSWQKVSLGSKHNIIRIDTMSTMYIALSNTALFTSTDNAQTWKSIPINGGIDICHSNDSLYILTQYSILHSTLTSPFSLTSIIVLDSTLSYRKIITTDKGTLHWIEQDSLVASYNITTKTQTLSNVLSLYPCPTCKSIDGLQYSSNKLFVAIVDSQAGLAPLSLPDEYYHVFVSANAGTSWEQFLPVNVSTPLGFSNYIVTNDSTIIALRRKDVGRKVAIAAQSNINLAYVISFLMFEYVKLTRSGTLLTLNPADTIPERYASAVDSKQRITQFIRLDNTNLMGVGNNHCIVRSTDNGSTWKLQSYFPDDEGKFTSPWYRSPTASTLYMPRGSGGVYKTTNNGVTILPQRFKFYPQYLHDNIVFSHFDSTGKGCIIFETDLEKDANVFVTNDYGETYTPASNISLFHLHPQDAVNRSRYKLIYKDVRQLVETTNTFLISGTPTYWDSLNRSVPYPYSIVIRLDKSYNYLDTVRVPVPRILTMNAVGNTIYVIGMDLNDWSAKQSLQDVVYPKYAMYRSTDEGKTWDSIATTIPLPNEYSNFNQKYYVVPAMLQPSYFYNKRLIYGAGSRRFLYYSEESEQFDTLQLPFTHLVDYTKKTFFRFRDKLVTASVDNSIMITTGQSVVNVWDSTHISAMIPWYDTHELIGFTPTTTETGFVVTGEYKDKLFFDVYKTHLLQYKPAPISTAVEEESSKTFVQYTTPYPQPSKGIVSTVVTWDTEVDIHDIRIGLFDVLGNRIYGSSINLTPIQQNAGTLTLDCSALPNGMYVIRVQLQGATRIIPIVVN